MSKEFDKLAEKIGVVVQGGTVSIETVNVYQTSPSLPEEIPQNLPYSGARKFVGRSEEIKALHQQMQQTDRVVISAVSGMGGIGKTELAIQYALQQIESYSGGVCWFRARENSLNIQIVEFARLHLNLDIPEELRGEKLSLNEQVKWCWQYWKPSKGLVLLVLDDVSSLIEFREITQGLPKRFRILVTTRQRNLDVSFSELSLDVLSPKASLDLLIAIVGEERIYRERQNAEHLCKWLGYLPLGLELVGRYLMEDPDLSLVEMLQRLKEKSLSDKALDLNEQESQEKYMMTAQLGVRAAFDLTWQELSKSVEASSPNWFNPLQRLLGKQTSISITSDVALLLGLFASEPFPWTLVDIVAQPLNWSANSVDEARKQLYKRHLIQQVSQGLYVVHPLIRYFLQTKSVNSRNIEKIKRAFTASMSMLTRQEIPDPPTRDLILAITPCIPHMAEVATTLIDFVSDKDLTWAFAGLGRFYDGQGFHNLARPWYEQCLSVARKRFNENHPDLATCLNNLAHSYENLGLNSEAKDLYEQALVIRRKLFGDKSLDVAATLGGIATIHFAQGEFEEAVLLDKQALEIRKKLLKDNHHAIAESLNNLAAVYAFQRRYSDAEPLILEALRIWRDLLGDNHPYIATCLSNLAVCYEDQGQNDKAETLFLKALEIRNNVLNDNHPEVATNLTSIADLYASQGRYGEAEPFYLQAIKIRKSVLGEPNHQASTNLNQLANCYESLGRYSEAESLYRQALEIDEHLFGSNNPDIFPSLNNLGLALYRQKKYLEAETFYNRAKVILEESFEQEHEDLGLCFHNLSALYDDQGMIEKAIPLCKQAQAIWEKTIGSDQPLYARSLDRLAGIYTRQGRSGEAEFCYERALAIRNQKLGVDHPDTVRTRHSLDKLRKS